MWAWKPIPVVILISAKSISCTLSALSLVVYISHLCRRELSLLLSVSIPPPSSATAPCIIFSPPSYKLLPSADLHHVCETPPVKVPWICLALMAEFWFLLWFSLSVTACRNQVAVGPLANSQWSNPTPVTNYCRELEYKCTFIRAQIHFIRMLYINNLTYIVN